MLPFSHHNHAIKKKKKTKKKKKKKKKKKHSISQLFQILKNLQLTLYLGK